MIALVGGVLLYARSQLFDPASLGDNAATALADEDVRTAISPTIAAAIGQVSPEGAPTEEQVADALSNPRVAAVFGAAAGAASRQLFEGKSSEQLDLDLSKVTATAIAVTEDGSAGRLGVEASDFESAQLDLISGQAVLDALDTAERIGWLGLILTPLGLIALILSIGVARERMRAASFAFACLAVGAVLVFAALYVGREVVLAQFRSDLTQDAVSATWSALLGGLGTVSLIVAGVSAVVAVLAGMAAARSRPAYY